MLLRLNARVKRFRSVIPQDGDLPLSDDFAGVHPGIDIVNRAACDRGPCGERLRPRLDPRKRRQQRWMNINDAARKCFEQRRPGSFACIRPGPRLQFRRYEATPRRSLQPRAPSWCESGQAPRTRKGCSAGAPARECRRFPHRKPRCAPPRRVLRDQSLPRSRENSSPCQSQECRWEICRCESRKTNSLGFPFFGFSIFDLFHAHRFNELDDRILRHMRAAFSRRLEFFPGAMSSICRE